MSMLDALAGCEDAIGALVTTAQAQVAAARAERLAEREASDLAAAAERAIKARRKHDMSLSASNSGESDGDASKQPGAAAAASDAVGRRPRRPARAPRVALLPGAMLMV